MESPLIEYRTAAQYESSPNIDSSDMDEDTPVQSSPVQSVQNFANTSRQERWDRGLGIPVGTWLCYDCPSNARLEKNLFSRGYNSLRIHTDSSTHLLHEKQRQVLGRGTFGEVVAYPLGNTHVCVKTMFDDETWLEKRSCKELCEVLCRIGPSRFVIGGLCGPTTQLMDCGTGSGNKFVRDHSMQCSYMVYFAWQAQLSLWDSRVSNGDIKLGNIVYFNTQTPFEYVFKLIDVDGMTRAEDNECNEVTFPYCRRNQDRFVPAIQLVYSTYVMSLVSLFPDRRSELRSSLNYKAVCSEHCLGNSLCGMPVIRHIMKHKQDPLLHHITTGLHLVSDKTQCYTEHLAVEDIARLRRNLESVNPEVKAWYTKYYEADVRLPVQQPTSICLSSIGMRCSAENCPRA